MSLNGPVRVDGGRKVGEEGRKDERNPASTYLAPPNPVPDRVATTPGTTFSPGEFVFWIEGGIENAEKAKLVEAKEAEPGFSSQAFFRAHMDGVYTACRTMERWSIVDYDTHLDRLVSIMTLEPSKSGNRLKLNRSIMASVLTPLLRKLIQKFCDHDRNAMIELRLTILVSHVFNDDAASNHLLPSSTPPTASSGDHPNGKVPQNRSSKTSMSSSLSSSHRVWGNGLWQTSSSATASSKPASSPITTSDEALFYDLYQIWVFGEYMPEIPAPPIIVDLIHAERHNPTVKHVDWTSERKALSKQGTEGANEMIMMDSETRIYEGLSSNFMAVYRDGSVHTAPDNTVLSGTIRNLMLRCAKEQGVVVKMECPRFDQVDQWSAACVMSTSRLLLPIHKLNLLQPIQETMEKDESRDVEIKSDLPPSHSSSHHHVPIISTFATPATPIAPHGLVSLNGIKGMEGGSSLPPVFTLPSSPSPPQTVGLNGSSSPQHPSSPQPALQNQQQHQHVPSIVRSDSSCSLSDSTASLGSVSSTASHVTSSSSDSTAHSAKIPPHHVASQHEFMEDNPTVVKLMKAITSKMRLSSTSMQVQ